MKYFFRMAYTAALIMFSAAPLQATVSMYAEYYVPFQPIQRQHVCLSKQIMEAEIGIPLASVLLGTFAETKTLHQAISMADRYENINLLANKKALIRPVLTFDRYRNGVFDYSFTLDMAPLNTLNGMTSAGRQRTLNVAKLAVIATVKTAELVHGKHKFRVWMKFNNLPSRVGLSGATVNSGGSDWPTWPYTSGSPVYKRYFVEMIDTDCRKH